MPRNCANSYGYRNVVPVPRLHKVRQLMLKRPFKSLIARIAIIALALSLVVPFVPAAFAQDTSIGYPENGAGPVQTFTLSDQDASSGGWSVGGADAKFFGISSDGALSFKSSPNFEEAKDVGGDNVYNVTVKRSGGSSDVAVMVTNVDEGGSVMLDDLQPQVGAAVSADVSDPDGDTGETMWQWAKSMDKAADGEAIAGATSAGYTPGTGDVGYYLRATASYSDGLGAGRDNASAVTAFAVEKRPAANSQPSFPSSELTRMVKETATAGSSVGNAVVATDSDNDPLLYKLDGGVAISLTGGTAPNADPQVYPDNLFTINAMTGQISVKSGAETKHLDRETFTTGGTTLGADDAVLEYTVTITATDPSGSQGMVEVTIKVKEVNEAPVISRADADAADADATDTTSGGDFVVTTPEEVALDLSKISSEVNFGGLPVFKGDDPEDMHGKITWSLSGPDSKRFQIADIRASGADADANVLAMAALRWATPDGNGPSFEAMDSVDGDNVYLVTVTASDGSAGKSQAVSIEVTNQEEYGSVSLTQLVPQEGIAITARLSDQDGSIAGTKWQWYRGDIDATDADIPVNLGYRQTSWCR